MITLKSAKTWLHKNGVLALWAAVIGTAWLFVFSTALAAEPGAAPHHNRVIRLHVLAHDDSAASQELKLAVRDGVWALVTDLTSDASSLHEARVIFEANLPLIQHTAQQIVARHGSPHAVTAFLLDELEFPVTSYGGLIFPQGLYSAVQIIIGDGDGGNWWCVMFPAMCLMQVSRGRVYNAEADGARTVVRPRLRVAEMLRGR